MTLWYRWQDSLRCAHTSLICVPWLIYTWNLFSVDDGSKSLAPHIVAAIVVPIIVAVAAIALFLRMWSKERAGEPMFMVCMHTCGYVYIYIYIIIFLWILAYVYWGACMYVVCVNVYICIYIQLYSCESLPRFMVCIYMRVYKYTYIYIYMCVYVHINRYDHIQVKPIFRLCVHVWKYIYTCSSYWYEWF